LSPENLTCDGELSRAQVQARYKELMAVAHDLAQLDPGERTSRNEERMTGK
jgi:hypothetical protein